MIILFGTCTKYAALIDGTNTPAVADDLRGAQYAMWMDTHSMVALGFGFLYTLLRRYGWSGVSLNFIITAFCIQWALLCNGFYESVHTYRHVNASGAGFPPVFLSLPSLINADYTAATVLISFGALLGRVSAAQMLVMTFFEVRAGWWAGQVRARLRRAVCGTRCPAGRHLSCWRRTRRDNHPTRRPLPVSA